MAYYYGKDTLGQATNPVASTLPADGGGDGGDLPESPDECSKAYNDCLSRCQSAGGGDVCRRQCEGDYLECTTGRNPYTGEGGEGGTGGANCGQGAGPAWDGCSCGKFYNLENDGDSCIAGYVKIERAEGGYRCECQKWCQEIGYEADCTTKSGAAAGFGEFTWPGEMGGLYKGLIDRANEVLTMPYGWSPEAMASMFGQDFEKIREGERGTRRSLTETLAREGMTGTGAGLKTYGDLAWGTEKNISDMVRNLFVTGELQKKTDIKEFTDLASKLFEKGMSYHQIAEAINASRRGESLLSMQLLLQLLNTMGQPV